MDSNKNQWLFVSPDQEKLTILCHGQEPYDNVLYNSRKLILESNSKGYGIKTLIQSQSIYQSNYSNKDLIPKVNLTYDCCEIHGQSINSDDITIDIPVKHVVNNFNYLKFASHKIDEIEQAISDQKWKLTYSFKVNNLYAYIGAGIVLLCLYPLLL